MKIQKKYFVLSLIILSVVILFSNCEDQFTVRSPKIYLEIKKLDSLFTLGNKQNHRVEIEVISETSLIQWEQIDVKMILSDSIGMIDELQLLDDGNFSVSGDFLSGDHVYTTLVNDSIFKSVGEYKVLLIATYESEEITLEKGIRVLQIAPFGFHVVFTDDSLEEKEQLFTLVLDSGDTELNYDLSLAFMDSNNSVKKILHFSPVKFIQNEYTLLSDSSFGAGLKGLHQLKFELSIEKVETHTFMLPDPVYVVNTPPVIKSVDMPDSLKIPSSGTLPFDIFVTVDDKRGIGDISRTFFRVRKPDGTYSSGGKEFELNNDGTDVDAVAGDNVFSARFVVANSSAPGTYTFEFLTEDKVQQHSDTVTVPVVLY